MPDTLSRNRSIWSWRDNYSEHNSRYGRRGNTDYEDFDIEDLVSIGSTNALNELPESYGEDLESILRCKLPSGLAGFYPQEEHARSYSSRGVRWPKSSLMALIMRNDESFSEEQEDHSIVIQQLNSPDAILGIFEGSTLHKPERLYEAILLAESFAFTGTERNRLLAALSTYISNQRFTDDENLITIVGSAIRKYALNMSESDFESYAGWLYPVEGEYPTHRVELELVKAICWRLTFEPTGLDVEYKDLAETLFAIAYEYSTSRFLPRKNHGAIALNAAVSIFILDAISGNRRLSGRVLKRIEEADSTWFKEMLIRRLGETVGYISAHCHLLSQRLERLVEDQIGSEP